MNVVRVSFLQYSHHSLRCCCQGFASGRKPQYSHHSLRCCSQGFASGRRPRWLPLSSTYWRKCLDDQREEGAYIFAFYPLVEHRSHPSTCMSTRHIHSHWVSLSLSLSLSLFRSLSLCHLSIVFSIFRSCILRSLFILVYPYLLCTVQSYARRALYYVALRRFSPSIRCSSG